MADTALIQNIKSLMAERGMKQAALAHALGVTPSTVSAWFSGRISPSMNVIDRICSLFGITHGQLMDYNDSQKSPHNEKEQKFIHQYPDFVRRIEEDEKFLDKLYFFTEFVDPMLRELVKLYA